MNKVYIRRVRTFLVKDMEKKEVFKEAIWFPQTYLKRDDRPDKSFNQNPKEPEQR